MNKDLKKELYQIIDAIEDEQTLHLLKEDLLSYTIPQNTDGLTPEQLLELDKSIGEDDTKTDLQEWQSFKTELQNKWREG